MSKNSRIPEHLSAGFTMMTEGGDSPAEKIAIPVELPRLMAIPIPSKGSIELDPVLHESIRLYNANYQGCEYCLNARAAVAVQSGLDEDLVDKVMRFEDSDLPDKHKAALRITHIMASAPKMLTQEVWDNALKYYSEQEVVDIVLLSMFTTSSKVSITLGLDPGMESSSRLFFPGEEVYSSSQELKNAVEELERQGIKVRSETQIDYKIKPRKSRAK